MDLKMCFENSLVSRLFEEKFAVNVKNLWETLGWREEFA
jgi:hypothetical protein